jgi:pimeloyl-ACP methyl ester carboxylesterase
MPLVRAAGRTLNYEWLDGPQDAPVLVFLHEGLGSIRQWRDFPAKLVQATATRGLVYDRYGYGQSDVLQEPRREVDFMHDEALKSLPELLSSLEVERPVLVGHSDGASISLIHAGAGFPVRGIIAMAPHVFIEPICISSIRKACALFEETDLKEKLGRYHRDVAKTFYGWADVWRDPHFTAWDIRDDYLPKISCPVLGIQGLQDEYGTMAQLDEIAARAGGTCKLLKLDQCGHSPFRDQAEAVLAAAEDFARGLK